MDKIMHIDIVTPEKITFQGDIKEIMAPGIEGEFGVLPGHAPFATVLKAGVVTIINNSGAEEIIAVSGGYVEVESGKVILLVETAERSEEIDAERAKRKLDEKERLLKGKSAKDIDFDKIQASLLKEIARMKAIEIFQKKRRG
jgi:F-type H+-transporting ATPase subunit epsilon